MSKQRPQEIPAGSLTPKHPTLQELQIFFEVTNEKIEALETEMLAQQQIEVPVKEYFINGMYAREIVIPAGTLLTGRVWKQDYFDIMVSGHIAVATPAGVKDLSGYNVCDGKAGRKRAGYAFEDTQWITVHPIAQKEANMVEALTFFSMAEFNVWRDRRDYYLMALAESQINR